MRKISTCLWYDDQAEAAVEFYSKVFDNVETRQTVRYDAASSKASGQPEGSVMLVDFTIEDHDFTALNGGPHFNFTPAISFFVNCESETKVEELHKKLVDGGQELMPLDSYPFSSKYAWVQDKFGVSWQLMYVDGPIDQKIMSSLMFVNDNVGRAEEALEYYTSLFRDAKKGQIARYPAGMEPDQEGTLMFADFQLEGLYFGVMDSAQEHDFSFTEAISFVISCENQDEIDYYWKGLSAHPEAEQCGWLKDKFGVSWQVVPAHLDEMMNAPDSEASLRVSEALMQMKKIDIATLEAARDEGAGA